MAIKHVTIDDLDASEGAETRTFAIEGVEYEIDLIEAHAKELYRALEPFIESARRVQRGKKPARPTVAKSPAPASHKATPDRSDQLDAIREWGRKNGYRVSNRGRVPKDIVQAFEESHGAPSPVFSATSA